MTTTPAHPLDVLSIHGKHVFTCPAMAPLLPPSFTLPLNLSKIHHRLDCRILLSTPSFQQVSPSTPSWTYNRILPPWSTRWLSHICNWILLLPCLNRQELLFLSLNLHHQQTNQTQTLLPMPPTKTPTPLVKNPPPAPGSLFLGVASRSALGRDLTCVPKPNSKSGKPTRRLATRHLKKHVPPFPFLHQKHIPGTIRVF